MALHFILDGYNIIKSDTYAILQKGSLEEAREHLISFLANSRPQGSIRNLVTVVFDSHSDQSPFDQDRFHYKASNIQVVFSRDCTADEEIEGIVRKTLNKGAIVVVTDDRGLCRLIGGFSVKRMSVSQFLNLALKSKTLRRVSNCQKVDKETIKKIDDELTKKWLK